MILIAGCHSTVNKNTPQYIESILNSTLPEGWKSSSSKSIIVIQYKEKVDKAYRGCLPLGGLKWSKGTFFVKLHFKNKLSNTEYIDLFNKRNKLLLDLNKIKGICGKSKCDMSRRLLLKYPLPKYYNDNYSIFIERSEYPINDDFIENKVKTESGVRIIPLYTLIKPKKVEEERDNILKIIDKMFKKYKK